jgi:DNA polymerase-3 subunit epsilon
MRVLCYDTETTGLWNFKQGVGHPDQPDMVQLAAILFDSETCVEYGSINIVVIPEKPVEPKAAELHGVTPEVIERYGVSRRYAIAAFDGLARNADMRMGHNESFDSKVLEHAYTLSNIPYRPAIKTFCTMHGTTNLCKLPHANGRAGYKWPKLIEAYCALVDPEGFEGAHDALADVRASMALFFHLRDLGLTPKAA